MPISSAGSRSGRRAVIPYGVHAAFVPESDLSATVLFTTAFLALLLGWIFYERIHPAKRIGILVLYLIFRLFAFAVILHAGNEDGDAAALIYWLIPLEIIATLGLAVLLSIASSLAMRRVVFTLLCFEALMQVDLYADGSLASQDFGASLSLGLQLILRTPILLCVLLSQSIGRRVESK